MLWSPFHLFHYYIFPLFLYWFAHLSELVPLQTHSGPDLKLCLVKTLQHRLCQGLPHWLWGSLHTVTSATSHIIHVGGIPVTLWFRSLERYISHYWPFYENDDDLKINRNRLLMWNNLTWCNKSDKISKHYKCHRLDQGLYEALTSTE